MPYIVLARRYRPQSFEELVGQEHVVRVLQNAIKTGRIHHAYIFSGARGTGKTTTARILAKALNCEHGPTPEPCNECAQCIAITEGHSVDVLEIDGASHTGVDNVRNLREELQYLPTSARYKVVIIDEVHMLSTAAFNALLKTLEEPPEHVIFILATTEPHKIPATIHSRCQHFEFRRLDTPLLAKHLANILQKEGVEYEDEALRLVAIAGEGSVRDSLSILDQVLAHHVEGAITAAEVQEVLGFVGHDMLASMVEAILARDSARVLELVKEIFEAGFDLLTFTKQLVEYFRDLLIIKAHPHPEHLVAMPMEEISRARELTSSYDMKHLHMLFTRLFDAIREIGSAHSQRTALELILTEMVISEPLYSTEDLVRRVEALEKRLKAGAVRAQPSQAPQAPQAMPQRRPQPVHAPQMAPQGAPQRPQAPKGGAPEVKIPDIPGIKGSGSKKNGDSPPPPEVKPEKPAPVAASAPEKPAESAQKGPRKPEIPEKIKGKEKRPAQGRAEMADPGVVPDFSLWRRGIEGITDAVIPGLLRPLKFRSGYVDEDGTVVFSVIADVDEKFMRMLLGKKGAIERALGEVLGVNVLLEISTDPVAGARSLLEVEAQERSEDIRAMKEQALDSPVTRMFMDTGLVPVHFRPLPDGSPIPIDRKEWQK